MRTLLWMVRASVRDRWLQIGSVLLLGSLFVFPAKLAAGLPPIKTVFLIVVENHGWYQLKGDTTNAPFINRQLIPASSYCEAYMNLPGPLHPSLPNYIWLEAGTNFGIYDDNGPDLDHIHSTNHLVAQLKSAGVSWKSYFEDVLGTSVPLYDRAGYAVRHNPFAYFDDVTATNDPNNAYAIAHMRPYSELDADLTNNTLAAYNYLKPNICNDGHDSCSPFYNPVLQIDTWLSQQVPKITNSTAFKNGGALFITFDENDYSYDQRIMMLVLSPFAKGSGYSNTIYYDHSSTLRTFQEIFGVRPFLGAAANASDLSDLFVTPGLSVARMPGGMMQITAAGVTPGSTNIVQASSNLLDWVSISTNVPSGTSFSILEAPRLRCYYRLLQ